MKLTVELERTRDGDKSQWRATVVLPPERRVHGYGPNVPAALAQLARAIERHAVNLLDVMLSTAPELTDEVPLAPADKPAS